MTKLFVVTLPNGNWLHDQTPDQVARILASGEGSIVVTPEPEGKNTYDVFYGSDFIEQGWSQHREIKADSHRRAVARAARHSQHGNGAQYLVVGPDADPKPWREGQKVGRVFEINQVSSPTDADFTATVGLMGTCHYDLTEIRVVPKDRYRQDSHSPVR